MSHRVGYGRVVQQTAMDDREDPAALFFKDKSVDLYAALNINQDASLDDIKKAYRKLALVYHPDKHATKDESAKADASLKFQQIGFAYTVLGDEKRRQRYDKTGKTDEGFEMELGEDGWEAYFENLFDRVTREKLDEMKKEYQGTCTMFFLQLISFDATFIGSVEETEDLKKAYLDMDGSIEEIMNHIPHSTHDDEARFIIIISGLISKSELPALATWESSTKDEKGKLVRKKQAEKEAKEAEELARELGVWDEFYGSGKTGSRKGKNKGKGRAEEGEEDSDHSGLQALILKKNKKMNGFLDDLAAKYAEPKTKGKGKRKRKNKAEDDEDVEESPRKKKRGSAVEPPEIDAEEFEKLQQKLFGDKSKNSEGSTSKGKKGRTRKGK
ncbi:hypothetical protein EW146_g3071 [Bondarzewia mesenterica]|uniref:J domain-containing protein n=1 Tax=Bondarzewia mesenterica TaxID=1095465 RepID=A0A4S4LYZ5_9AGAM|nr:hypothetical protein EW146_g3071 [Bondarzewia mesenterica]